MRTCLALTQFVLGDVVVSALLCLKFSVFSNGDFMLKYSGCKLIKGLLEEEIQELVGGFEN